MLIGLCGYARVGKDSIAALMPGWIRRAFATQLKLDVDVLTRPLGLDVLHNDEHKIMARELLVAHGRLARAVDPNYWIDRISIPGAGDCVITDVRYANEVEFILGRGGQVVRVCRDGYEAANEEERLSMVRIWYDWPSLPLVSNIEGNVQAAADAVLKIAGAYRTTEAA